MSRTNRVSATAVVLGLAVWTLFQALMTLVVAQQEEGVGLGCTEDLPKVELIVTTGALGIGLVLSIALFWTRSTSAAWLTLAGSIALAVCWILLGGFGAFDCVLDT